MFKRIAKYFEFYRQQQQIVFPRLQPERVYMPNVTVKERIIDLLNKQCAKGELKYCHTLDDCPDDKFDWKLMAMEEMIDLIQYQQKEIMRLERLLNP